MLGNVQYVSLMCLGHGLRHWQAEISKSESLFGLVRASWVIPKKVKGPERRPFYELMLRKRKASHNSVPRVRDSRDAGTPVFRSRGIRSLMIPFDSRQHGIKLFTQPRSLARAISYLATYISHPLSQHVHIHFL
jgi:hypothetical protein